MFVRERWLSSVCEVITDPSADAFFPTVMEVHSMPSVSSSGMTCACNEIPIKMTKHNNKARFISSEGL